MSTNAKTHTFAGFDDYVEVFRSGTHTDSSGNRQEWTDAHLDQIVANFDANDSAPVVIGHPKTDSPAWGWVEGLKRDGSGLFAKFNKLAPQFVEWAKAGHVRNRSVKILPTAKGYKLGHVGFLGAAPPAIEGLAPVQFDANQPGQVFEFALNTGYQMSLLARSMRRMRDFLIEKFGAETADRVAPAWDIEHAEQLAAEASADERSKHSQTLFTASSQAQQKPEESMFTQEQLDAAVAKAAKDAKDQADAEHAAKVKAAESAAEFSKRLTANTAFVQSLMSDKDGNVRLTPAQAEGWAEALTFAECMEVPAEFTFTAKEAGEQKLSLFTFMKGKLEALPPQLKLGQKLATTDARVDLTDAKALEKAASEFQAAEAKAGRSISISQAVSHIVANGGATA